MNFIFYKFEIILSVYLYIAYKFLFVNNILCQIFIYSRDKREFKAEYILYIYIYICLTKKSEYNQIYLYIYSIIINIWEIK